MSRAAGLDINHSRFDRRNWSTCKDLGEETARGEPVKRLDES